MKTLDKNPFNHNPILSKKYFVFIIIILLFNYVGCSSFKNISGPAIREEVKKHNDIPLNIITKDYKEYQFDSYMYSVKNDTLSGVGKIIHLTKERSFNGKIAVTDIIELKYKSENIFGSLAIVLGIVSVALLAALTIALVTEDY